VRLAQDTVNNVRTLRTEHYLISLHKYKLILPSLKAYIFIIVFTFFW
jgi:hypothetical protein